MHMENGYDSDVGEGGDQLSTGEKQLISFARAVLADPRIFVLDEATASIDTKTEELIQHAISTLLENRTSFLIAHRLSTIRHADLILVVRARQDHRTGHARRAASKQRLLRRSLQQTVRAGKREACVWGIIRCVPKATDFFGT